MADDDDEGRTVILSIAGIRSFRGVLGYSIRGGTEHVFEHGTPTHSMRHFGVARTHARAFAGGEDDNPDTSHNQPNNSFRVTTIFGSSRRSLAGECDE